MERFGRQENPYPAVPKKRKAFPALGTENEEKCREKWIIRQLDLNLKIHSLLRILFQAVKGYSFWFIKDKNQQ